MSIEGAINLEAHTCWGALIQPMEVNTQVLTGSPNPGMTSSLGVSHGWLPQVLRKLRIQAGDSAVTVFELDGQPQLGP